MAKNRTKRQKAIIKRRIFLTCSAAVLIAVIALVAFSVNALLKIGNKGGDTSSKTDSGNSSDVSSETMPETTATVISTGDIMVHSTQLTGAKTASGDYDFSAFFKEAAPYFNAADLAVANLEVTFGGTESGQYSGYPVFNTPDSLADAIKSSGLNFLITSNNHAYDTGLYGLKRTAQVLKQKGIEFTGTRETEQDPSFVIKEINGIKIGIANYTYETSGQTAGRKYLNGAIIAEEANSLINSFSYERIDNFYSEAAAVITEMKSGGADYILFYMHWGNEYKTSPDTWQKTIAQKLSNLGVNMIIGSHPHVIQPVELIRSEDGESTTVCVYSMGNCVSNQRQELMDSCPTGHTEDGMLFSFTLKKNGDGTVLSSIDLIPTWVNKYKGGSGYLYTVYPLENAEDGSTKYSLDSTAAGKAAKSYARTKEIVAAGLSECQQAIGCEITFK
ncbi:MAG: CapA family protein [Acutalibacteraceae bacterium]